MFSTIGFTVSIELGNNVHLFQVVASMNFAPCQNCLIDVSGYNGRRKRNLKRSLPMLFNNLFNCYIPILMDVIG